MQQTLKITLGDQSYTIQELTCGQVEDIQEVIIAPVTKQTNRLVISIALREDYPAITAEVIHKMRIGSLKRFNEVAMEVLAFAGYTMEPKKPGEAAAGAE